MINQSTTLPIYEVLYPVRERAFLSLYENEKINTILETTIQGSGKTIAAVKLAGKYNENTMMFVDTHRKAMEIYDEWGTFNNPMRSYLVSRTYKCTLKMKKTISEILDIDFKDNYVCNECNTDEEILKLFNKGYISKEHCWNCPSKNTCVYYGLKEHCLKKRQFTESRIIILVKSYIHTPFIEKLLETHKELGLIIDEGFLEVVSRQVNFSRNYLPNKLYYDWIKMVDWIVEKINLPEGLITTLWYDIKELLQTILNYSLTIKEREQQIGDLLERLYDKYFITDFEEWNEILKTNIYYYHYYGELEKITSNQFYDIQLIFEDIYDHCDPDEARDRIFINEQNKEFSYIINHKEKIADLMRSSKNCFIPSSNMNRILFEELLPEYINKFVYLKGKGDHQFKEVYQIRNDAYAKPTLYNPMVREDPITGQRLDNYSYTFYRLFTWLKSIIEMEGQKKILIVAQGDITKKIKRHLKDVLRSRNINTNNTVSIEYYYNLEGVNIYQHYDVVVLFGCAGIPPKLIKLLSRILGISVKKLENYFLTLGLE